MIPIQTLSRHEASVNCVVIHRDLLLSGSEDTEIKVCRASYASSVLFWFCVVEAN